MDPKADKEPQTEKQRQAMELFHRHLVQRGVAPSIREIANALDVEPPVAFRHLLELVRKKALEKFKGGFKLPGPAMLAVPVLARIHAGTLHEAIEAQEGYVPCPADLLHGKPLFGLRVIGHSMVDSQIADGDVVICEAVPEAAMGDIVVALVDGRATVKHLKKINGKPALVAANKVKANDYPTVILGEDAVIQGRVVAVHRNLIKKGR